MKPYGLTFSLLFLITRSMGCVSGPLPVPMVERLPEKEQLDVDSAWSNMLAPPERLDREVLLDVLLAYSFHHTGVDTVGFISTKRVNDGEVSMQVFFDRHHPETDSYILSFKDANGTLRRFERYTPDEVKARYQACFNMPLKGRGAMLYPDEDAFDSRISTTDEMETVHEPTSEEIAAAEALKARERAIIAATQPAGAMIDSP